MRRAFFFVLTLATLIFSTAFASEVGKGKTIIYIPIDNRPMNLEQTLDVSERLGYTILVPPEELLGTGASDDKLGKPLELWKWLNKNIRRADAAVISTDAMIYGSLVASRKHDLSDAEILDRARNFETLHKNNPYTPIFAFGTIMRTPDYNWAGTEKDYYGQYGAKIFQYTALVDKSETQKLSSRDKKNLAALKAEIPENALNDWLARRAKNFNANKYFIDLVRSGALKYFILGGDDGAMFSQTHLESRQLTNYAADLGKNHCVVTSGADELGMLMLSRAINEDLANFPLISVNYNTGTGAETFPKFSNEKISESIDSAIYAVGGFKISKPENADFVLAVNTNPNGKTFSADNEKNTRRAHTGIGPFMKMVNGYVKNGYPVGVADISASNGSDNALMERLRKDNLQFKIRSYCGWNTATNSSGFVIGAGVLTNFMSDDDVLCLLLSRYLEDWAYEANVRTQINNGLIWTVEGDGNAGALGTRQPGLEVLTAKMLEEFAAKNFRMPKNLALENLRVHFPWSRTFDADIDGDLIQQ